MARGPWKQSPWELNARLRTRLICIAYGADIGRAIPQGNEKALRDLLYHICDMAEQTLEQTS